MDSEVNKALYKVGHLIIVTGARLKRLSNRDPTLNDLNSIHEALVYCAEAITKISDAKCQENSRKTSDVQ